MSIGCIQRSPQTAEARMVTMELPPNTSTMSYPNFFLGQVEVLSLWATKSLDIELA